MVVAILIMIGAGVVLGGSSPDANVAPAIQVDQSDQVQDEALVADFYGDDHSL